MVATVGTRPPAVDPPRKRPHCPAGKTGAARYGEYAGSDTVVRVPVDMARWKTPLDRVNPHKWLFTPVTAAFCNERTGMDQEDVPWSLRPPTSEPTINI